MYTVGLELLVVAHCLTFLHIYIHDILQILANIKKAPQYSFTITDYDSDMICYEKRFDGLYSNNVLFICNK